jgi:glycosyltransferase involved in cell wall biosynthesis
MSEVLIDVTRLVGRFFKGRLPTGVDRVSLAYIEHFSVRAKALVRLKGRTVLLSQQASYELFAELLSPSPRFRLKVLALIAWAFCQRQNRQYFQNTVLFNTGHSGLEREAYAEQLRKLGVRPLFLIHDLIPITHPEYCRAAELDKHLIRMNNALNVGSGIIANSQATLDELAKFALRAGLAMPPAVAALLAPAVLPVAGDRPIAGPYFVILSTIEPRKNHYLLLQLWRRLVERLGDAVPKLVVIGQRGWECENVVDLLERCEALRGVVIELAACSDADMVTYLHHAQALLFPSFAEGYGMPLAEALSAGVPVIASDLLVFREIAGDIPDYLDPLDGMAWIDAIEAYSVLNSVKRAEQLERLAHFVPPTWPSHFQIVDALLERLG